MTAVPPGFSGAMVWRCRGELGEYALKGRPLQIDRRPLAPVHRVVCRTDVVPALVRTLSGRSIVSKDGWQFDCRIWSGGRPPSESDDGRLIREGLNLIDRFHRQTRSTDDGESAFGVSPIWQDRVERLHRSAEDIRRGQYAKLCNCGEVASRLARLLDERYVSRLLQVAEELGGCVAHPMPIVWCVGDAHRGNALFEFGDGTTGGHLIDPDSVRRDTPLADVARWVSSFAIERQRQAIDHWCDHGNDSDSRSADLITTLIRAADLLIPLRWAKWLFEEASHVRARHDAARARFAAAVRRIEQRFGHP